MNLAGMSGPNTIPVNTGVGNVAGEINPQEYGLNRYYREGVELTEYRFSGGTVLHEHEHARASLNLIIFGGLVEYAANAKYTFEALTCSFYPADHCHSVKIGAAGARGFHIELDEWWLDRVSECVDLPNMVTDSNGGDLAWLLTRLYWEYRHRDPLTPMAVEGLLLESLAVIAKTKMKYRLRPPAWLDTAVKLIHAQYKKNLTIDGVAQEIGVHPVHLSRVFRQCMGVGPCDYLRRLRVQYACREMASKKTRLIDIANEAGFADQSHFTRTFKQITGITPRVFQTAVNA
ncbi:MAG: AraC family transcriptional regulator [Gammaproteobacteria bacterium]|nr:AraC family transcriptional regulator [Gammaproteobacteria bacterium]